MALLDAGFGVGWDKKFSGTNTACPVRFVPPDSFLKRLTKESRIVELDEGSDEMNSGSWMRGSNMFMETLPEAAAIGFGSSAGGGLGGGGSFKPAVSAAGSAGRVLSVLVGAAGESGSWMIAGNSTAGTDFSAAANRSGEGPTTAR